MAVAALCNFIRYLLLLWFDYHRDIKEDVAYRFQRIAAGKQASKGCWVQANPQRAL